MLVSCDLQALSFRYFFNSSPFHICPFALFLTSLGCENCIAASTNIHWRSKFNSLATIPTMSARNLDNKHENGNTVFIFSCSVPTYYISRMIKGFLYYIPFILRAFKNITIFLKQVEARFSYMLSQGFALLHGHILRSNLYTWVLVINYKQSV